MIKTTLTNDEQARVRAALLFLHTRSGTWTNLAKVLGSQEVTIKNVAYGRPVSEAMAFRIARFARVTVDDVLAGRFPPPGTCPHCGHCSAQEGMPS